MSPRKNPNIAIPEGKDLVAAIEKHGSLKAVARAYDCAYLAIHRRYQHALAEGLMDKLPRGHKTDAHIAKVVKGKLKVKKPPKIEGRKHAPKIKEAPRAADGVTRFLFTCAQNNTKLMDSFWDNLIVLKEHYNAQLHVARFAYIKSGLGARGDKKTWFKAQERAEKSEFWFDDRIAPFESDDPLVVAPGLEWRGETNILPTASNPLSGLSTLTGRKSGIFPHVTIMLESVPSMERGKVKFNYTTGTVTQRNYIARKEGLKAEFHHVYGALLVEVDKNGDWWARQIDADNDGTICDLDIIVKNGKLTTGNRVEAITIGDVHRVEIDEDVMHATWGIPGKTGGIVDYLKPKAQYIHDVLDFHARSHHDIADPHQLFLKKQKGVDNVLNEVKQVCEFLHYASRPEWMKTYVVNSNHDRAMLKWLKNHSAMLDPENFMFWATLNARVLDHIAREKDFPVVLREAYYFINKVKSEPKHLHFLAQDESSVVCPDKSGGVEHGEHGDAGPNGSRGSTRGYLNLSRKITKGHDHQAAIRQNVHSVGTCRKIHTGNAGYTHGPSSWSHTHGIDYQTGKRALLTYWRGRFWAPR